jgi:transcriptional regulator with XRE-family HTH domain
MKVDLTFGEYILRCRKMVRLSQRELGQALGLSHVAIHDVEKGERPLSPRLWQTVCEVTPATMPALARLWVEHEAHRAGLLPRETKELLIALKLGLEER